MRFNVIVSLVVASFACKVLAAPAISIEQRSLLDVEQPFEGIEPTYVDVLPREDTNPQIETGSGSTDAGTGVAGENSPGTGNGDENNTGTDEVGGDNGNNGDAGDAGDADTNKENVDPNEQKEDDKPKTIINDNIVTVILKKTKTITRTKTVRDVKTATKVLTVTKVKTAVKVKTTKSVNKKVNTTKKYSTKKIYRTKKLGGK